MNEGNKREDYVPFKGCRPINKRQAKVVGFTLICGFLASAIAVPTLGTTILSRCMVLGITIVGYMLGKMLFG